MQYYRFNKGTDLKKFIVINNLMFTDIVDNYLENLGSTALFKSFKKELKI
jgi:hypothetical protein